MSAGNSTQVLAFDVPDMSCGHCAQSIRTAIAALDAQVQVQIDLAAHRVRLEGSCLSAAAVLEAIQGAGYSPQLALSSGQAPARA